MGQSVLDQSSPMLSSGAPGAASFGTRSWYAWQQEVHAGISGDLSAVVLRLDGPISSDIVVRVRSGRAWTRQPAASEIRVVKRVNGDELVRIDVSDAGLYLVRGDAFVLEIISGTSAGATIAGSYAAPGGDAPRYGFPLYFAGYPFSNGRWRLGFQTFVTPRPCRSDMNLDGGIDEGDVEAFYRLWAQGDSVSDVNNDGAVDMGDISAFMDLWTAGDC
jgi:hypothetical protein